MGMAMCVSGAYSGRKKERKYHFFFVFCPITVITRVLADVMVLFIIHVLCTHVNLLAPCTTVLIVSVPIILHLRACLSVASFLSFGSALCIR